MNKLIKALSSISLKNIVGVFLAGLLVLISTACSANPPAARLSGEGSIHETKGYKSELYKPVQPEQKGGMYPYSDTNVSNRQAEAKGKALVENAKSNINKVNNPEELLENYKTGKPFGERVKDLSESVGNAANEVAEDWKGGTQRGLRNAKNNTKEGFNNAQNAVEDASTGFKRQASKNAQQLQETAEDAGRAMKRSL